MFDFVLAKFVDAHISGRKHVYNVQNQQKKELKFKRSVFVKGFEPLLPCLEEELKNYFQTLECPVNDIYVDKNVVIFLKKYFLLFFPLKLFHSVLTEEKFSIPNNLILIIFLNMFYVLKKCLKLNVFLHRI